MAAARRKTEGAIEKEKLSASSPLSGNGRVREGGPDRGHRRALEEVRVKKEGAHGKEREKIRSGSVSKSGEKMMLSESGASVRNGGEKKREHLERFSKTEHKLGSESRVRTDVKQSTDRKEREREKQTSRRELGRETERRRKEGESGRKEHGGGRERDSGRKEHGGRREGESGRKEHGGRREGDPGRKEHGGRREGDPERKEHGGGRGRDSGRKEHGREKEGEVRRREHGGRHGREQGHRTGVREEGKKEQGRRDGHKKEGSSRENIGHRGGRSEKRGVGKDGTELGERNTNG